MAHDIAELQQACLEAEEAKTALLALRQVNRESMTKIEFREYNESTRAEQIEIQAVVSRADQAFTEALDEVRVDAVHQVVNVGTLNEGNQAQGVSS